MQPFVKNFRLLGYSSLYPIIHYLVYKSRSLDMRNWKAVILKMDFNISAAPIINCPNGYSRNL
jgi:hypothetical protein